jgi:crotonobetainyl-CoA:carnitine CoA-transferase CaiB-like acyl-CoA transferase
MPHRRDALGLPLEGVRVLSVEQFGAGPWATLQLADLGAEVIKIEDPFHGGDIGRTVPPYATEGTSLFFEAFNRGKRSIELDLRHPAGREVFHRLVGRCDAVFSNLRGDQPAKLGLTFEALRDYNPSVVCCSLTGFGTSGPRAAQPAYDYVIQGLAGWMSLTGEPDGPPCKSGLSLVDFASGYAAGVALMAGLWAARRTGEGCDCDISLLETGLALLNYVGTWVATAGYTPKRTGQSAHPSIVPFQVLRASDGWFVVACAKQKFWCLLCEALDRSDLIDDPRFVDFAARADHRTELVSILEAEAGQRTVVELIQLLEAHGVPCGPANSVAEALTDPQVEAREVIQEIEHPVFGTVRHIRSALRTSAGQRPPSPAPGRGADTGSVLQELCDYDTVQVEELRRRGAFGAAAGARSATA